MRRHRTSVPRLSTAPGYTLVEVVVAMLISCVMMTAVMGVAVTAKQGGGQQAHRMMFNQGIAQLSAQVKEYVTACGCSAATGGTCPSPGCADPGISGPNTGPGITGVNQWYLQDTSVNPGIYDFDGPPNAGGVARATWALSCGDHYITGIVPALEVPPYQGYIHYQVGWPTLGTCSVPGVPGKNDMPVVQYTAVWTEP
jgi:prepilin-type N-terminal cleavage/methylation domain-containing protein